MSVVQIVSRHDSAKGPTLADLELRNAVALRAGQAEYETPPDAPDYSAQEVELSITWAQERIGRAERALASGDMAAAIDLLREAGKALVEEMEACE